MCVANSADSVSITYSDDGLYMHEHNLIHTWSPFDDVHTLDSKEILEERDCATIPDDPDNGFILRLPVGRWIWTSARFALSYG